MAFREDLLCNADALAFTFYSSLKDRKNKTEFKKFRLENDKKRTKVALSGCYSLGEPKIAYLYKKYKRYQSLSYRRQTFRRHIALYDCSRKVR